jgi:DNA-binding response OmpR family regulator
MRCKVLVVDDERAITRLVELNLRRAGCDVITAGDAAEGLEKARLNRPDIIILDIIMPYPDGYWLLDELQADEKCADIPVVFLTARAQPADLYKGYGSGAAAYITKPFGVHAFVDLVRRVVDLSGRGVRVTPDLVQDVAV